MEGRLWTSSLICGKAFLGWGRKSIQLLSSHAYFLFIKPWASFPCQPHGSCEVSSRQPDKESGHRVGSLWSPCQRYRTSEWILGFNIHKHWKFSPFRCVYLYGLQGTIFSKTAMENYKDLGPQLFRMSISHCPAKRLGVPEEVCNGRKTQILQGRLFIKQKALLYFINQMFFFLLLWLWSDIIGSVFPTLTCCLLHIWSHPEGGCRTESVPFHVGDTKCVNLILI